MTTVTYAPTLLETTGELVEDSPERVVIRYDSAETENALLVIPKAHVFAIGPDHP